MGKIITTEGVKKCFSFVNGYDQKPKRRLFETLKSQELQMNQDITFLSDGGDTVRDLRLYLNPFAEYLLDWFHITMRLTVISQMPKGLPKDELLKDIEKDLESVKNTNTQQRGKKFSTLKMAYFCLDKGERFILGMLQDLYRKTLRFTQGDNNSVILSQNKESQYFDSITKIHFSRNIPKSQTH